MSKSIRRLTGRGAVLAALRLDDELGAPEYLRRHGFGKSYRCQLVHNGREYDSKSVGGVAYGFQQPNEGALRSSEFSGGTSGATYVLQRRTPSGQAIKPQVHAEDRRSPKGLSSGENWPSV